MFEKFTSAEAENFKQRYLGTYGFFRKGDKKTLVRLEDIKTGGEKRVDFVTEGGTNCFLYPDSTDPTVGFEFLPPRRGYHNVEDTAYLLSRIPARQYLRGICSRNTEIRSVYGNKQPVNFVNLARLFAFNTTPRDCFEAMLKIAPHTRERSFALSGQFAYNWDTKSINCLGERIGQADLMDDHTLKIKLNDFNMWHTEIKDALQRGNIPGVVA